MLVSDCQDTISTLTATPTLTVPPSHPFTPRPAVVLPEPLSCCAQITPTLPCFVLVTVWFQHRPIWTDPPAELKQKWNEMTQKNHKMLLYIWLIFLACLCAFSLSWAFLLTEKSHGLKLFSYIGLLVVKKNLLCLDGFLPKKRETKETTKNEKCNELKAVFEILWLTIPSLLFRARHLIHMIDKGMGLVSWSPLPAPTPPPPTHFTERRKA